MGASLMLYLGSILESTRVAGLETVSACFPKAWKNIWKSLIYPRQFGVSKRGYLVSRQCSAFSSRAAFRFLSVFAVEPLPVAFGAMPSVQRDEFYHWYRVPQLAHSTIIS